MGTGEQRKNNNSRYDFYISTSKRSEPDEERRRAHGTEQYCHVRLHGGMNR
jgi:hypothetical protein